MARIDLVDIGHRYPAPHGADADWALKPMTLTWNDGGAYALLGPSGCGKTTLLNIISGLLAPTQGRIEFDARDVTTNDPQSRNIAQVFQFPVVYDTMTVFDNLAFPLRNRRWKAGAIRERVHEVAAILELSPVLAHRAAGLSADVKQKISLGRGLVRPDVAAVLFDEPLTVIDPHLKWLLRRKLKQIHQQLRLSMIYVTHDQTEALTFADQVVVMSQGEVVQAGTPEALFETPAHRFVGHFIGTPGMNFIPCTWREGVTLIGSVPVTTSSGTAPASLTHLVVGIRPDYVGVVAAPMANALPARILSVKDQGTSCMVQLSVADTLVWAKLRDRTALPADNAFVHLPSQRCALYANDRRVP